MGHHQPRRGLDSLDAQARHGGGGHGGRGFAQREEKDPGAGRNRGEGQRTRLIGRGTDDLEQIERRLQVARAELAASGEFPYVVHNDRLDEAAEQLERIVRAATA